MATLAANMVHLSGGFAAGFSAPTMAAIQKEFDLEDSTKNWFGKVAFSLYYIYYEIHTNSCAFPFTNYDNIASILVVGQIFGCIAGGMVTDLWGRRRVLIAFLSLSVIGKNYKVFF